MTPLSVVLLQFSVCSGYSDLGESASQVASRVHTPGAASQAGSDGSSVRSSVLARVAHLESELADARMQTQKLEDTLNTLKLAGTSTASDAAKGVGHSHGNGQRKEVLGGHYGAGSDVGGKHHAKSVLGSRPMTASAATKLAGGAGNTR